MPAEHGNNGPMTTWMRLLSKFRTWWQSRAVRRRARLHSFMGLSDRALADIGIRRAHVCGALVGAMPLGQSATTSSASPADAQIWGLPRHPAPTAVATDLSAAA